MVGHYDLHNFNSNVITFKNSSKNCAAKLLNDFLFVFIKCFIFVLLKKCFFENRKFDFSEKLKNEVFEILDQTFFFH